MVLSKKFAQAATLHKDHANINNAYNTINKNVVRNSIIFLLNLLVTYMILETFLSGGP